MRDPIPAGALDQLFRSARTFYGWTDAPVEERVVRDLYDLLRWGPTSANSSPARFAWVHSPDSLFPHNPRLAFEEAGHFA